MPGDRNEIAEVTQFHALYVIVNCYYHKQIIRFPRFNEPCDKGDVNGMKSMTRTKNKILN